MKHRILLALVLMAALPGAVFAALGGDEASVEADRVQMKATSVRSEAALYSVHEIQIPSGTTVREFVSRAGVVFAVTWKGPFMPDLRQTFGAYFPAFQAASRAGRSGHSHLRVEGRDLVVHSTGHLRAFAGLAYVPSLVPAGVSVDHLQ